MFNPITIIKHSPELCYRSYLIFSSFLTIIESFATVHIRKHPRHTFNTDSTPKLTLPYLKSSIPVSYSIFSFLKYDDV